MQSTTQMLSGEKSNGSSVQYLHQPDPELKETTDISHHSALGNKCRVPFQLFGSLIPSHAWEMKENYIFT